MGKIRVIIIISFSTSESFRKEEQSRQASWAECYLFVRMSLCSRFPSALCYEIFSEMAAFREKGNSSMLSPIQGVLFVDIGVWEAARGGVGVEAWEGSGFERGGKCVFCLRFQMGGNDLG